MLAELAAVAEVEAETLRLPPTVLSVSVEADSTEVAEAGGADGADGGRRGGCDAVRLLAVAAVCVGGTRPTRGGGAVVSWLSAASGSGVAAVTHRLPPLVLSVSVEQTVDGGDGAGGC